MRSKASAAENKCSDLEEEARAQGLKLQSLESQLATAHQQVPPSLSPPPPSGGSLLPAPFPPMTLSPMAPSVTDGIEARSKGATLMVI